MKAWQIYVTALASNAWKLDARATVAVLGELAELLSGNRLTDAAVAAVLRKAGVAEGLADLTAPSIRGAAARG